MTRKIVVRLQLVPAISSSRVGGDRSGRDGIVVDLEQHQLDLEPHQLDLEQHQLDLEQHMEDLLEQH